MNKDWERNKRTKALRSNGNDSWVNVKEPFLFMILKKGFIILFLIQDSEEVEGNR